MSGSDDASATQVWHLKRNCAISPRQFVIFYCPLVTVSLAIANDRRGDVESRYRLADVLSRRGRRSSDRSRHGAPDAEDGLAKGGLDVAVIARGNGLPRALGRATHDSSPCW